jgi:hypothetical protein
MWRSLNIRKVTVSNFKVRVSENHWKFEIKMGPACQSQALLNRTHRSPTARPRDTADGDRAPSVTTGRVRRLKLPDHPYLLAAVA